MAWFPGSSYGSLRGATLITKTCLLSIRSVVHGPPWESPVTLLCRLAGAARGCIAGCPAFSVHILSMAVVSHMIYTADGVGWGPGGAPARVSDWGTFGASGHSG